MPLFATPLARLGSRFSLLLDPIRRQVHYGALGLQCQAVGELLVGLRGPRGPLYTLPLTSAGTPFFTVDQHVTPTSVRYEAYSPELGVRLDVTLTAPFWPQDEPTSLVPAYLVDIEVSRFEMVRWEIPTADAPRRGMVQVALKVPGARVRRAGKGLALDYAVRARDVFETKGPGIVQTPAGPRDSRRVNPLDGRASDRVTPLEGPWSVANGELRVPFDLSRGRERQTFSFALVGYCGDALFERHGAALPMKYTTLWRDADDVAAYVRRHHAGLRRKAQAFDRLVGQSGLPPASQHLAATAFQSYLMCTLWCAARGGAKKADWFSVWEGSCWFNSTVDVTYNEALLYFSLWPELLERLFEQWAPHANDRAAEQRRRARVSDDDKHGNPDVPFPGAVLEHDMGAGWSANGQSYHHAMPVEENANFLLLLYAHARWWGKPALLERHAPVCRQLAEYLLWADSTGNGFPDRGTANTIDDATPAVQYGRDNVYLGVKRLAALHAAGRIFEHTGDAALARRCRAAVRTAVRTLNAGWLDDHWGVCLDRSAKGLVHNRTGKPLPYRTLPGWDAYHIYTANGLLYLLMVDDLPPGLDRDRLRTDLQSATQRCLQTYGCSHSSADTTHLWLSMNLWRDTVAGYLGDDLLELGQRYWSMQLAANGAGSEKANCFTETSLTNNLVWYPRGAAVFGLLLGAAGLVMNLDRGVARLRPSAPGRWPLLPLADWRRGRIPWVDSSGR